MFGRGAAARASPTVVVHAKSPGNTFAKTNLTTTRNVLFRRQRSRWAHGLFQDRAGEERVDSIPLKHLRTPQSLGKHAGIRRKPSSCAHSTKCLAPNSFSGHRRCFHGPLGLTPKGKPEKSHGPAVTEAIARLLRRDFRLDIFLQFLRALLTTQHGLRRSCLFRNVPFLPGKFARDISGVEVGISRGEAWSA